MKEKIQAIRSAIPVPIGEAMQLLKAYDGDVERCVEMFKANALAQIIEQTGCDAAMASEYYEKEKYDFNRAVSFIREDLFDRNYHEITGLTRDKLQLVINWLHLVESNDFGTSLAYDKMGDVVEALRLLAPFAELADVVEKASEAYNRIFEGYTDALPLSDFVHRHRQLDDEEAFLVAQQYVPLRLTVVKDEVLRHARNLRA